MFCRNLYKLGSAGTVPGSLSAFYNFEVTTHHNSYSQRLCSSVFPELKAAVHWERPGCALAKSSPNLTLAAMGLLADSAHPQRVSGSARTDSRRAESARNPIAADVKFGDDCATAQPGLSQWTAAFMLHPASLALLATNCPSYRRPSGGVSGRHSPVGCLARSDDHPQVQRSAGPHPAALTRCLRRRPPTAGLALPPLLAGCSRRLHRYSVISTILLLAVLTTTGLVSGL